MKSLTIHWWLGMVAIALGVPGCSVSPASELGDQSGASMDNCVAKWIDRPDLMPSDTPERREANEKFLVESFELCDYAQSSVVCAFQRSEEKRDESLYLCTTSSGSLPVWVPTHPIPRFNIAFDYRFDTLGFFDVPKRKRALEYAARIWEEAILSEFPSIPSDTVIQVPDPSVTRKVDVVDTLIHVSVPEIDDILVFVASVLDDDPALASTMPNRYGTDFDAISSETLRQQLQSRWTSYPSQPWAGVITFNHRALDQGNEYKWSFDTGLIGPAEPDRRVYDFTTAATHELMHVLGIHKRDPVFAHHVVEFNEDIVFALEEGRIEVPATYGFAGSQTVCEFTKYLERGFQRRVLNKEEVTMPLDDDLSHPNGALTDIPHFYALINPTLGPTLSSVPGRLDFALLKDIGYQIATPDCL